MGSFSTPSATVGEAGWIFSIPLFLQFCRPRHQGFFFPDPGVTASSGAPNHGSGIKAGEV